MSGPVLFFSSNQIMRDPVARKSTLIVYVDVAKLCYLRGLLRCSPNSISEGYSCPVSFFILPGVAYIQAPYNPYPNPYHPYRIDTVSSLKRNHTAHVQSAAP